MPLALCHSVPRDVLLRGSVVLLLIAVVLQAVIISGHNSEDGVGELRVTSPVHMTAAKVAAYGTIRWNRDFLATHDPSMLQGESEVVMCNYNSAAYTEKVTIACARFGSSYTIINGLLLSAFIASVLVLLFILFVLVRISRRTGALLVHTALLLMTPTALLCSALGVLCATTISESKRVARDAVGGLESMSSESVKVVFHHGVLTRLGIAATAFLCASAVLAIIRCIMYACGQRSGPNDKEDGESSADACHEPAANNGEPSPPRLINDDWVQQRQMWHHHAGRVRNELEVLERAELPPPQRTEIEVPSAH